MSEYYIPNHVFFVVDGDAVIFMDLRSDQYTMMVGADARTFDSILRDSGDAACRTITMDEHGDDDRNCRSRVISELIEYGLLTTELPDTNRPAPLQTRLPERDLVASLPQDSVTASIRDVYRFAISSIVAKWRLTFTSIDDTVRMVERRRRLRWATNEFDFNRARTLVCIYNRLTRLLPVKSKCLYDSLRLLEFLAKYDCFPSWVFAVQIDPWYAHCWVQQGTVAFNQDADGASTYVPIMSA